jgi:methionyl-tRNA formyltransferase
MTPWPGTFALFGDKRLKIFRAKPVKTDLTGDPGSVLIGFANELRIATGDGVLSILEVQSEAGRRLNIKDFLLGHPIKPGMKFN